MTDERRKTEVGLASFLFGYGDVHSWPQSIVLYCIVLYCIEGYDIIYHPERDSVVPDEASTQPA
jgi:hypothetical protein